MWLLLDVNWFSNILSNTVNKKEARWLRKVDPGEVEEVRTEFVQTK